MVCVKSVDGILIVDGLLGSSVSVLYDYGDTLTTTDAS